MRLYSFVVGLYLSELQKGLQTGHCVSEYTAAAEALKFDTEQFDQVVDWSKNHKTIIILNAHTVGGVKRVYEKLDVLARKLGLPYNIFHEDEESLGGIPTATSVIVPAEYYQVERAVRTDGRYDWVHTDTDGIIRYYPPGTVDFDFVELLRSHSLA